MFIEIFMCMIMTCTPPQPNLEKVDILQPQVIVGYKPYTQVLNEKDVKCLTDNIYFEARNEKDIGKKAVALVTLNRLKEDEYPNTICRIVHQRNGGNCQFSWTCSKVRVTDLYTYNKCRSIAKQVLMNYEVMHDVTKGATNFHRRDIQPTWAKRTKRTVIIGKHIFYKL